MTLPVHGRAAAGDRPALVFVRYENEYLLSQVWESEAGGLALPQPSVTPKHALNEAQPESSVVVTSGREPN